MADARMVLRTVYLTPEVDEKLRIGAFEAGRSKNDLIRDAITQFLGGRGKAKAGAEGATKKPVRWEALAKHKPAKTATPSARNPKNPAQTWTGRGVTPRWLTAAIEDGKKVEDFAIAGPAAKGTSKQSAKGTRRARRGQ
jgi:hypothetical protein